MPTVIDAVIEWNRNKSRKATDPADKARYDENIRNLKEYKQNELYKSDNP